MNIHVSQLYRFPSDIRKRIIQMSGDHCNPENVLVIIGESQGYLYCTDNVLSYLQIKSQEVCVTSRKLLMCCDIVITDGLILKNRYGRADI